MTQISPVVRPGAQRLIFFHIVAAGRCWVELDDGQRLWANRGDVIVMPYGDDYSMGGQEPADRVPILTLVSPPPWEQMPVLSHGAGGQRTDLVCGYLHSEDPLFDPALRALPPAFVVRLPDGPASQWVDMSIRYALTKTTASLPAEPFSTRLPELVLIEVLRIHLASAPATDRGWIAALHDPVLAPALARLHAAPERKWTVTALASSVAVSRSVLDERFRRAGTPTHPLPLGVAHAPRRRSARQHRRRDRLDRRASRLRLRRGLQPRFQTQSRHFARGLAPRAPASPTWLIGTSAEAGGGLENLEVGEVLAVLVGVCEPHDPVRADHELLQARHGSSTSGLPSSRRLV